MYCIVGNFHWSLEMDHYCPHHGSRDRWGNKRDKTWALCGDEGPYDAREDCAPFLDCCSIPNEEGI